MGWEQRGNGMYYYRKIRRGNRVVSEYVGNGEFAYLAASLGEEQQEEEQERREEDKRNRAAGEDIDKELARTDNTLRSLTTLALKEAGYHKHKGQWRKLRHAR